MVGIFKEIVSNVRVFTFGAAIVFVESCWQNSGSLTNVATAARAVGKFLVVSPM